MVDHKFLDYTLHTLFDDENSDKENEHQISQQGLTGM